MGLEYMRKLFLSVLTVFLCFSHMAKANEKLQGDFAEGYGIEYYTNVKKQVETYKAKVENCSETTNIDECFYSNGDCPQIKKLADCYDDLAKQIINEYYSPNSKENLKVYKKISETLYDAFSIIYCQNKFNYPSGKICITQTARAALGMIKNYLLELLHTVDSSISVYLEE